MYACAKKGETFHISLTFVFLDMEDDSIYPRVAHVKSFYYFQDEWKM